MTSEEYQRLDVRFAHCSGANCKKAQECLHHTTHKMLVENQRESYAVVNPTVIMGEQPCPLFERDHRECYAWGISGIYDNVRMADLRSVKLRVMHSLGSAIYYKIKEQRRAITGEEQQNIRQIFTDMGYDGNTIVFNRYEEQYPTLMRLKKRQ